MNMLKRMIAVLLGVLLSATLLIGCQFVEYDSKRDLRQIVATVQPIEDKAFPGGKSTERHIYKYDLVNAVGQQFQQSTVPPTEEDVDNILQSLIERELLYLEVERLILKGDLPWRDGETEYDIEDLRYTVEVDGRQEIRYVMENGVRLYDAYRDLAVNGKYRDFTDVNKIKRAQFDSIDQELRSLQKTILSNYDEEVPEEGEEAEEESPQYPVREQEVEGIIYPETKPWSILDDETEQSSRIPGRYNDPDRQSLERQALSTFVINIVEVVRKHDRPCDEVKLKEAETYFRSMIAQGRYEELYLSLDTTYPIEFLTKESLTRQFQMEALQTYLTKGVEVTSHEVAERYDSMLKTQKLNFTDASAYESAISNNETILYRPTGDIFYVKHILVPFSEAQTAALTAYKAKPNVFDKDIKEFRDERLFNEMVAYPRDMYTGKELIFERKSATDVFNEVYGAVKAASSDPKTAERIFDDFIYRYNTDPGAFTATSGYTMDKKFDENNRKYMEEFELGGEDLLKNYAVGDILPYPVITDYGMHIMYYASNPVAGEIKQLNDYETSAEHKTIYELLEGQIKSAYESRLLDKWSNDVVNKYTKNDSYKKTFKNRYKSIYKVK